MISKKGGTSYERKIAKWAPAFAVLIAVVIGAAGLGIGILQTHASTVPEDVIVEATPTPTHLRSLHPPHSNPYANTYPEPRWLTLR